METIGSLLVKLLFDDASFDADAKGAEKKFEKLGQGFANISSGVNKAITGAFVGAGLAVTGFVGASAAIGAGFQKQIDVVGAISGATEAQLGQLEDRARELGATTVFTATQAAEGLRALAQSGATVDEAIRVSGDALNFATANSVGLERATQALISTQRQFASSGVDSARASDVLTKATQSSLLSFEDLNTALRFGGPTAASFNISLEETATGLAAFRDLGFEASQAGTALRATLIQASTESEKNGKILESVGLTFEKINPQANGFIGIVENIATSTAETDDILALFGARAGPAVANLVQNIRSGNVDLQELNATISDSANVTANTVTAVSDNVATQLQILTSAIEDVFLETFTAIAGPIQIALESLQGFFNDIGEAIGNVSTQIEGNLTKAAESFGSTIEGAGEGIAATFANVLLLSSQLVLAITPILNLFLKLVPLADDLAFAIGTAFLAGRAAAFVRALASLPALIAAATAAMTAFGTATTVSTGGLSALAAGVAVVVVGLGVYINTLGKAQAATNSLTEAQAAAAVTSEAQADAIASRLEPLLKLQQTRARELLETSTDLSEARASELQEILRLTTAEAAAAVATGRLIETNRGLRTVQSLVEEGGRDQAESLRLIANEAGKTSRALKLQTDELRGSIDAFDAGEKSALVAAIAVRKFTDTTADTSPAETITLARQRLIELTAQQVSSAATFDSINRGVTDSLREQLKATTVAAAENARGVGEAANDGADARIDAAQRALDEINRIQQEATSQGAGLFLTDPQQIRRDLDLQLASLELAFAEVIANTEAGSAQRLAAETASQDALLQLRANTNNQLRELEEESNEQRVAAQSARSEAVGVIVEREVGLIDQIRRESVDAIEALESAAVAERIAITEAFAARAETAETAEERIAIVEARNRELTDLDKDLADQRVKIVKSTGERITEEQDRQRAIDRAATEDFINGIRSEAGPLQRLFDKTVTNILIKLDELVPGLARGITDGIKLVQAGVGALSALTGGFGLDIAGTVTGIIDASAEGAEAITAAEERIAELQEKIIEAGDIEDRDRRKEQVAALEEELAEAQEELTAGQELEQTTGADLVTEAVDAALAFTDTLAEQLGDILIAAVEGAVKLVQNVAENLDEILIGAIDGAISLIENLGEIVASLVGAVDEILIAVLTRVDDIILALVLAVPEIIIAVIAGIPDIIFGLIEGLLGPEGLVTVARQFVFDVVAFIITELPGLAVEFVKGIPDALKEIFDDIVQFFVDVFNDALGFLGDIGDFFKKEDNGGEGGGVIGDIARGIGNAVSGIFGGNESAQGGIPFIQRTTNRIVHAGEGILTAAQNRDRLFGPTPGLNPITPTGPSNFPSLGGRGGDTRTLIVQIGDQEIDRFNIESDGRGGRGLSNKANRRKSGVRSAFRRPNQE